jgi:hypothetical protein
MPQIDIWASRGTKFGVVYAIFGADLIKIGFSTNLSVRFSSMKTDSPVKLSLLAQIPGTLELEKEIHEEFAEDRAHGEWFKPSSRLLDFVEAMVDADVDHIDAVIPEYKARMEWLARESRSESPC